MREYQFFLINNYRKKYLKLNVAPCNFFLTSKQAEIELMYFTLWPGSSRLFNPLTASLIKMKLYKTDCTQFYF
jgi:hypothetical protein